MKEGKKESKQGQNEEEAERERWGESVIYSFCIPPGCKHSHHD